jgi:hypothetical protein
MQNHAPRAYRQGTVAPLANTFAFQDGTNDDSGCREINSAVQMAATPESLISHKNSMALIIDLESDR